MAFKAFPLPVNTKPSIPTVTLHDTNGGRRLSISRESVERAGLKAGDPLIIEYDEDAQDSIRIRRGEAGEVNFGVLSMPRKEKHATFSTGGRVLFTAGYVAGTIEAKCGPGWVLFDASVLRPQPWTVAIDPEKALGVLRSLVADHTMKKIIDEQDVAVEDVNDVRRFVGEHKINDLKGSVEQRRQREFARLLARWKASVPAKAGQ